MSRLEEMKGVLESWGAWSDWNESQRKVLKDLACLLERVQELEYASKYNGELNEFLQKRKLPPITLGRHVVDVVMDYAEELEKAFDELDDAYIDTKKENEALAETRRLDAVENVRLWEENQRYKQALEEIVEAKENNFGWEYPEVVEEIVSQALEGYTK